MAVLAMTVGEKARVWIEDPRSFGYGERGSFSFPAVPPLAELVYEVELVAFEPPEDYDDDDESEEEEEESEAEAEAEAEGLASAANGISSGGEPNPKKNKKKKKEKRPPRSAGSLTYEERLEAASRRKLRGNALLNGTTVAAGGGASGGGSGEEKTKKNKDPAAALRQYQLALSYLDDDFLFQLEGPHLEAASALARAARLNSAAARLALGDARRPEPGGVTAVLVDQPSTLYEGSVMSNAYGGARAHTYTHTLTDARLGAAC